MVMKTTLQPISRGAGTLHGLLVAEPKKEMDTHNVMDVGSECGGGSRQWTDVLVESGKMEQNNEMWRSKNGRDD